MTCNIRSKYYRCFENDKSQLYFNHFAFDIMSDYNTNCIAKSNKPIDCYLKAKTAYWIYYFLLLDNTLDYQGIFGFLQPRSLKFKTSY